MMKAHRINQYCVSLLAAGILSAVPLPSARAQVSLLKEAVIVRNQAELKKSIEDGSYRGEAGLLRMRPEVARSFGIRVFIDQDYLEAKQGFEKAEAFLDQAKSAMTSRDPEPAPGFHVQKIADSFLSYSRTLAEAKLRLSRYRGRLSSDLDDRLKDDVCSALLERLLTENLKKAGNRLREGLGNFYNICQGIPDNESALTSENVEFVNEVFNRFKKGASEQSLESFGLDRIEDYRGGRAWVWKEAVSDHFQYTSFIEEAVEKLKAGGCETDPLLFLALIRRESNFDPFAVSPVGAAGLTQMMPGTGSDAGMMRVFIPDYLAEAGSLADQERKARGQAMAFLYHLDESNKLDYAARARDSMQRALDLCQQKEKLYTRYRNELLEGRADDRLNPASAIEFGYRYFCRLMKEHGGDVSLALAAYNAGIGKVKEYRGIPPFGETVRFRNRVLEYYRDYLRRLGAAPKP
jgi:Transglycosylase SLT domain